MGSTNSQLNVIDVNNWTLKNDKRLLAWVKYYSIYSYGYSKKCDLIAEELHISPYNVDKRLLQIAVEMYTAGSSYDYILGKTGLSITSIESEIARLNSIKPSAPPLYPNCV